MKKTYISSDISTKVINGINSLKEMSNHFSSVLINIPDDIFINDEDLIWYQDYTGEQIDIEQESNVKHYSSSKDKLDNHILYINPNQSKFSINTLWDMEINIKQLLFNFIYAKIKQNRTFDKLEQTKLELKYDSFLEKFINLNILTKYKFDKLELYIFNKDIKDGIKYQNVWNKNIDKNNLNTKYTIVSNNDILKIQFNQENSSLYIFEYYYSVKFIRI